MSEIKNDNTTINLCSTKGQNRQFRKIQITQNNPDQYGLTAQSMREKVLAMEGIQYACGCEEISESGTPHIHIFFFAPGKKRFAVVKKRFPHAHIEAAYGSCIENRDYIAKSGKWEDNHKADTKVEGSFWEHGMLPSERAEKEPDMAAIMTMIEDGATTGEIVKQFPKYALQTKKIDDLQSTLRGTTYSELMRDVNVTYILGPDTVDKVGIVYSRHEAKDICRIAYYPENKRLPSFDHYKGQSVMIFDNFIGQIPLDTMQYFLGKYPAMLPARYADKTACYTDVYIISDIPPDLLYFKPLVFADSRHKQEESEELVLSEGFKHHLQQKKQFLSAINTIIEVDDRGNIIREEDYHYEHTHKVNAPSGNEP